MSNFELLIFVQSGQPGSNWQSASSEDYGFRDRCFNQLNYAPMI